jgi:UDP:flavonoid glycosyltransferase YjiC (YdhE family)
MTVLALPHAQLFPRMAALVHHGGAGTTAAATRAGRPQLLVPHVADQRYWGERIATHGLGPRYIPRPALSLTNLTEALARALADHAMQTRCQRFAEPLRQKNGLHATIRILTHGQKMAA